MGGENYTVLLVIGVKQGKFYYDHYLTQIEKGSLIETANSFIPTDDEPLPSFANNKDSRLWKLLQDNYSKVVDENGEPRVMYHGGKGEITAFNPARIGSNIDNETMGAGFYFTSDKQNAENYARNAEGEGPANTTSVYLNIRNPKRIRWNELSGDNKKESEAFTAKAKAQGYDGFIAEAVNGATWYVAFEPSQIKSATENNGEFSRENDDIRFSIKAEPDMDNATLRSMMENVDSADTMKEIVYEIFKRVAKGNLSGASIPIGKITDFGIDYLKEVTGKDFGKSTQFVLNLPDLKHIFDRHYETDRYPNNARALNENDIKAIVDLMMAPESIAPVSGSDNKYWFFMPNGVEVSVLLDVKGKKKLMPKSYYIAKAGNMSSNNDYVNRIQVATSKTRTTNPAYEANIPPIFDFANSFSNEDIKKVEGAASFRVSPAQDAEYMSAVEAGDIDKAEDGS